MRKAKKGNWEEAMKIATVIMDSHQRREATIEDITQAILHFAQAEAAREREACAKVCKAVYDSRKASGSYPLDMGGLALECAKAIRKGDRA